VNIVYAWLLKKLKIKVSEIRPQKATSLDFCSLAGKKLRETEHLWLVPENV